MRMTNSLLKAAVATIMAGVTTAGSYTASRDNFLNLLDKIADTKYIPSNVSDKLPELDGEEFADGAIIEEYFEDLVMPIAYDPTGANTKAPHRPARTPAFYSYPLDPVNFPATLDRVKVKEASLRGGDAVVRIMTQRLMNLNSARAFWRYTIKKGLLGKFAAACAAAKSGATTFVNSTAYSTSASANVYLKTTGAWGVLVKDIAAADALTWSTAVSGGYIVPLELEEDLAAPTDETSSDAFIERVLKVIEDSEFANGKNNLSGRIIQVSEENKPQMLLLLKKGIMPTLRVQSLAAAINKQELVFNVKVKVIEDFGNGNDDINAMLVDSRGVKLHIDQVYTDEETNAEGHFNNVFVYDREIPFYSPCVYVHVFREPAGA